MSTEEIARSSKEEIMQQTNERETMINGANYNLKLWLLWLFVSAFALKFPADNGAHQCESLHLAVSSEISTNSQWVHSLNDQCSSGWHLLWLRLCAICAPRFTLAQITYRVHWHLSGCAVMCAEAITVECEPFCSSPSHFRSSEWIAADEARIQLLINSNILRMHLNTSAIRMWERRKYDL